MTCFHSAKMVFIRAKIHINLKKAIWHTLTHLAMVCMRSFAHLRQKKTKTLTERSTMNTSVATGMETFKNLKIVPYVHRLYASWITESNPLFLRLSLSFTGNSIFSTLFARAVFAHCIARTLEIYTKNMQKVKANERRAEQRRNVLLHFMVLSFSQRERMLLPSKGEQKK